MEDLDQAQTFGFVMPSSEADRKHIQDVIKEISSSKTRSEAERDFQKEAIAELSKKFNIPKDLLSQYAVIYHKSNYSEVLAKKSDLETLVLTLNPSVG